MLNQIIQKAFRYNATDTDFKAKRADGVFFASCKALLNE